MYSKIWARRQKLSRLFPMVGHPFCVALTPRSPLAVLRERAQRDKEKPLRRDAGISKSDKSASQKLTKGVLEDQMRTRMHSFWEDVKTAEEGIDNGDMGALDDFIYAAGTMIENYRLAKGNFAKNRVSRNRKTGRCRRAHGVLGRVQGDQDEEVWDERRLDESGGGHSGSSRTSHGM